MNISEKMIATFVLVAVGFFSLNIVNAEFNSNKTVKASVSASQIDSLN